LHCKDLNKDKETLEKMGLEIVSEGSCLVRPKVTKHKVTKVTKHKVTKVKHDQNESCPNKNTIELVCD